MAQRSETFGVEYLGALEEAASAAGLEGLQDLYAA